MQTNYNSILDALQQQILSFIDLTPQNQWQQELNKDGYTVHSRINPENGLKINRTQTKAKLGAQDFIDLVYDITRRKEFDTYLEEGKVAEIIDDQTQIVYGRGAAPVFFISARDFIYVTRKQKLDDGRLMIVSKSIPYPQIQEIKGVLRAELLMSSCVVTQISETEIDIIIIGNMDPKGSIPKFLVNQGSKFEAEGMKKAVEYLKQINLQKQQKQ